LLKNNVQKFATISIVSFCLQIRSEPSLQPDIRLGQANLTVGAGDTARLDCRVRSPQMPHIKWLRRLESGSTGRIEDDGEIIPVGEDKYRIIASSRYSGFSLNLYIFKCEIWSKNLSQNNKECENL